MTCKKGKAWLSEKNLNFVYRHIEKERLSREELKDIAQRKKIPVTGLINPKSKNLKDMGIKLADVSEEKALESVIQGRSAAYPLLAEAGVLAAVVIG